jgi:hypothetical protein
MATRLRTPEGCSPSVEMANGRSTSSLPGEARSPAGVLFPGASFGRVPSSGKVTFAGLAGLETEPVEKVELAVLDILGFELTTVESNPAGEKRK